MSRGCGGKTNLLAGDMHRHVVPQDVIIKHMNLCPKAVLSPVQPKPKNSKKFETNLIGIVKSHVATILSCKYRLFLIIAVAREQ